MSFYLKYRPRKIDDLDLDGVREVLKKMAESRKFPKSLLLVGPRGGGKTSTARIVAKLINCEKGGSEPCLECEMCKSIEKGSNIDVIEMDAASNRGIDAIRELRDKINLSPVSAPNKVYIIDEVHMLTSEAFNALLKTLEEPPEHAYFVLCTTEEHKVPETILSRCTKVQFYKASSDEVKRSLSKVASGEGLKIDKEGLELLAGSVDGSFREGHKLLEVLAASSKEITTDDVRTMLGQSWGGGLSDMVDYLLSGKTTDALKLIDSLALTGVDWMSFMKGLLENLRIVMKSKYGIGKATEKSADISRIKQVIETLSRAAVEMKTAVIVQLPLEIAVVELGLSDEKKSENVVRAEENVITEKPLRRPDVVTASTDIIQDKIVEEVTETPKEDRIQRQVGKDVTLAEVMEKWSEMLSNLAPKNHSVAGLMRAAKPKAIEDNFLIVEVFYKFHKEQLEQDSKRRLIEEALMQTVGMNSVRLVLGEKAQQAQVEMPEHDNIKVVGTDLELVKVAEDVFGM